MLLAALLLSAALVPQSPETAKPPASQVPAARPAAAPAAAADTPAAPVASPTEPAEIAAGLAAFRKHRFQAALAEFEKAEADNPQSAAAAYYLGYTYYKLGEPSRRMNANKEKARELFAKAFSLDPTFKPTWH
jgi:tetratricopeptide (TPR) repeat protein